MKLSKITIGATIPTGNFSNIKVDFEVSDFTNEKEAIEYGLKYTKQIWERFGATPLVEKQVKSSVDKINEVL